RLKHNANRADLVGKRVVLVDDSIVRGTTSTKIVEMVRNAGAREVHMRISSPPTAFPCFYGIATPSRDQLLAARFDVEQMARHIGVDSLAFISIDGLSRDTGACTARFQCDVRGVPPQGAGRPRPAGSALLRRLFQRRLPDPAGRRR